MPIPASSTNLLEPIFLTQPLLVPLCHLDAFLPEEAMMREGETPFVLSGQQLLPSLSATFSPLSPPEHPRLTPTFAHTPCSLQTLEDTRGHEKAVDADQKLSLESATKCPDVDTVSLDNPEPSSPASRCVSMFVKYQRACPVHYPSLPLQRAPDAAWLDQCTHPRQGPP